MSGPGRLIRQVSRHLLRQKGLSLGSFLVLTIVLILVDLLWVASITINGQYRQILRQVRMEIFISDDVPDSALTIIDRSLRSVEGVASVEFISKDEAARVLEEDLGAGILGGLEANPLPRSFMLSFAQAKSLNDLEALEGRLKKLSGIDAVEFGRSWIERVERIERLLRRVVFGVGALILCIVLLTMANTNRLTAWSKSKDFFQLKLLGAGPTYLLYPFLAEGFLSAGAAAVLGWALLWYVNGQVTFSAVSVVLPGLSEIIIYSFLAGFTGMVGAYLGIRRLLLS